MHLTINGSCILCTLKFPVISQKFLVHISASPGGILIKNGIFLFFHGNEGLAARSGRGNWYVVHLVASKIGSEKGGDITTRSGGGRGRGRALAVAVGRLVGRERVPFVFKHLACPIVK